ncbi:hypothetical protein ACIQUQ_32800 [Streptomyces sp. NPDC101118]|uniref:hypothetical protein n=1 Tax=Streptomyces sp. NPDC101118 TaxID=3366109 RepID=UPI00382B3293
MVTARRALATAALLGAVLAPGGCADPPAGSPAAAGTPRADVRTAGRPAPARPAGLQAIAAAVGCAPVVSVDAEELRQGGCRTPKGTYRMATFATAEGLRAWLAEARAYGGSYLVGDRWVVTASPETVLPTLRPRLGGTLQAGAAHGTEHGGGQGTEPAPENGTQHGTQHGTGHGSAHGTVHGPGHGTGAGGPRTTPGASTGTEQ